MVSELMIRWPGGQHTTHPDETPSIGRDPSCAIVVASPAISRQHGRFSVRGTTWVYEDLGSTQGSFVDGVRIDTVDVGGARSVTLGRGPDAVALELSTGSEVPAPPGLRPAAGDGSTRLADGRPGLGLAPPTVMAAPPAGGSSIRVRGAGGVQVVLPGQRLSVGRDAANGLVLLHESVSRHHLVIEEHAGRWTLRDLGSSAGTWLDGRRVTSEDLSGVQTFRLGDVRDGPTITVESEDRGGPVVPRTAKRSGRRPLLVGLAALLVLVLAGSWFTYRLVTRVSDTDLARGTVLLIAGRYSGSGTVVDKAKGLILTNAHVAAPDALGYSVAYDTMEDDLEPVASIDVSVTSGPDRAAEPRFRGVVVAADGYLDLAVVRITETTSGALVEPDDLASLTELPLGDSDELEPDDAVQVVGYPGAARSDAPTFTRGVVSGVAVDKRLGSNRAYVNTDARINHGNSGGLAADRRGHLVGVPTLGRLDQQTGETALFAFRPVNFAKPLIEAAQADRPYQSPWTVPAPQGAEVTAVAPAAAGAGLVSSGCAAGQQPSGAASFAITYKGFPGGENTDLLGQLFTAGTESEAPKLVAEAGSTHAFPTPLPAAGCFTLTFDPRGGYPVPAGDYVLRLGLGGNLHVLGRWDVTVA